MSRIKIEIGILWILTSLLVFSCQHSLIEDKSVNCYFQYEYLNQAWGFNHYGFMINPVGEVYSFDKNTPWVFAEKNQLSNTSLQNNIKASVKIDTLIRNTDLNRYKVLAFKAMVGLMSEPLLHGADKGIIICKILVPDSSTLNYREIILSQTGDIEFHNLAPEAELISGWLRKITYR